MNTPMRRALTFTAGFTLAASIGGVLVGDSPALANVTGPSGANPLRACVYHSAMLDFVPDLSEIPGQYIAQLPCEGERKIVAGSCFIQAHHNAFPDFGLAGSHPYENGGQLDVPDDAEAHEDVGGENGWACRVNKEPHIAHYFYENDTAKVAVGALCCY